ncbi:MAG: phage tail protein I [Acetatifactor sp.]|nr:phage tail protein I [Acetatifactor sp.]
MGGMKVSELEFVRLLPAFMRDDEAAIALSKAMNRLIGEPSKRLKTLRVWDNIDNLNEAECDELAWELDVDWYDSTGMSLEEKRATLKIAQQIKRKRGTKWAVERLISAYFGEGYIMEWYEMYGTPYTFVALTTNAHITAQNYEKFVEAVKAAKNVRSHLAGIFYFWQQGPDPGVEYALGSSLHRYNFVKCGTRPRIATVGFIVKQSIETEPEEKLHLYGFPRSGTIICGTHPRPGTLGAAAKNEIAVEGSADHIRYNFNRRAGTYPRPGILGAVIKPGIEATPETDPQLYGFTGAGTTTCGTYPRPGTLGHTLQKPIGSNLETELTGYGYKGAGSLACGTYPRTMAVGATIAEKAAAAARLFCGAYGFIKCGTRGTGTKGATITNKAATAAGLTCAAYSFVRCGTRRCGE